ncbi:uncharacterized protein [Haliaeetus albicilla]|uniref:uncharacterized protein n=1 Tax=Haliaeetus albicilla TaxID=8969 RepID=UPI0037E785A0
MCCHAQSLPEESELQQPVKSDEVSQRLGCNEAVEFREENTPNETMMDVEYLQKDNSSSKPKHTENKLETDRRKLDVAIYDKIKTDRILKQFLNFSAQESSVSGNRENKLHTEQENLMGFGNQSKEEENGRKDCFVSAEICVSVNKDPGEMLNEQIVNGERQKTEAVSKKLPEVEVLHKTTGKKFSRKAGGDVSTEEEYEMQSQTNFELTMKKDEVTPKTGRHALDISLYKQPRTHFECQCKEHCFTETNSHNTLKSEDRQFQVCGEKGDSLSGVRDVIPLEKVASSSRELAEHNGREKTKLNVQSVSNPGVSAVVERDTTKLHRASLDKSYFIAENIIIEKSNLNPNEAKSTMREILAVSSGNISENQYAAKVSESYPLDFEVSPVQSDPSLGTELLGNAADLNANTALSEIIYGGEDYVPLSEHQLAKKLLSHDEKVSEKKISQGKMYGLDNINISGEKQSGEDKFEQGQKCKDLLLVAEMDSRDKGHSTKVPGKNTELQKTFCEKTGKKASLEKKEKQNKRGDDNEQRRSTTVIKVPQFLCNASETVNLKMILNQSKSTFESQNMSSDLKLIEHNLNNEYANDILITVHFEI